VREGESLAPKKGVKYPASQVESEDAIGLKPFKELGEVAPSIFT
jgi:hypothetical protein